MKRIVYHWNDGKLLAIFAVLIILSACGSPDTSSEQDALNAQFFLNPYKQECEVNDELRLCYVANAGDTGDYAPYEGQIENFEYEWGYGYALTGTHDQDNFVVDEVENKTAEEGGVKFQLVFTGGGERIVKTGEGTYEIYGEKSFVCDPSADCAGLDSVITIEEPITFDFQTPDNPSDPYLLLAWST